MCRAVLRLTADAPDCFMSHFLAFQHLESLAVDSVHHLTSVGTRTYISRCILIVADGHTSHTPTAWVAAHASTGSCIALSLPTDAILHHLLCPPYLNCHQALLTRTSRTRRFSAWSVRHQPLAAAYAACTRRSWLSSLIQSLSCPRLVKPFIGSMKCSVA